MAAGKQPARKTRRTKVRESGKSSGETSRFSWAALLEKAAFVLLSILVIGIPLLFSWKTKSNFIMPKAWLYEPAVALIALIWGAYIFFSGRLELVRTRLYIPAVLFLFACVLSFFRSSVSFESSKYLIAMLAAAVGGALVANLARTRTRVLVILIGLAPVACVQSLWGIAQKLKSDPILKVTSDSIGTLGNSNYLGAFLGLLMPLTLALGLAGYSLGGQKAKRALILGSSIAASLLIAMGLVITECQGAYISTGLALLALSVAWVIISPGRVKIVAGAIGTAAVITIIAIAAASLVGRIPVKRFAHLGERAVGGRILMWEVSMKMVRDHPLLGVGIGAFHYNYLNYIRVVLKKKNVIKIRHIIQNAEKPHNAYIQFWSETGSFGLASFLVLLGFYFYYRLKTLRRIKHPPDFWVHAGILTGFMGFSALLFVSSVMGIAPLREYFWIFMGLSLGWERAIGMPEREVFVSELYSEPQWRKAVVFILAIVLPALWLVSSIERSNRHRHASILWQSGIAAGHARRIELAIVYYNKALELIPEDMKLLFYRGSALIKMSETVKDKKLRRKLVEQGVGDLVRARTGYGDVNLDSNLGKAFIDIGRLKEGLRHYRLAAETGLKYSKTHTNLGIALVLAGRLEEARKTLENALKVDKKSTRTRFNLGVVLLKLHRPAQAEIHFRKLAEKIKNKPDIFNNLGLALLEENRATEAVENFHKALDIDPKHIRSRNNLAAALWKLNRRKDAIEQWRRVLDIDPDNNVARKNIEINAPKVGLRNSP